MLASPLALTNCVRVMPSRCAVRFMQRGKFGLRAADRFGQHYGHVIRRFDDHRLQRLIDRQRCADVKPKLHGRLELRLLAVGNALLERELALFDGLEREVGRHDLGERRRMPLIVGVLGVEYLPVRRDRTRARDLRRRPARRRRRSMPRARRPEIQLARIAFLEQRNASAHLTHSFVQLQCARCDSPGVCHASKSV